MSATDPLPSTPPEAPRAAAPPAARPGAAPAPPWRRYALIGAPLLVLAATAVLVFLPRIRIATAINGLGSLDGRAAESHRRFLMEHEDRALVDRLLVEAVEDESRSFHVRREAGALVLGRLGIDPHISRLLREGSLGARAVAVSVLSESRELRNFQYFVDTPEFRIQETVREWLGRRGDATRWRAIQLARRLQMADALDPIVAILDEPAHAAMHQQDRYQLVVAAAAALETFKACGELGRVLALAEADADPAVRRACLEIAVRASALEGGACPGALDPARLAAAVAAALDSGVHELAQQALLLVTRAPDLGRGRAEVIRELLERNRHPDPGKREVQRRHALDALAALGDPQVIAALPVYAHDPMASVRSSALEAAVRRAEPVATSLFVGVLDNETESEALFEAALRALRDAAGGRYVGLSDAMKFKASKEPAAFRAVLQQVFRAGEAEGLVRAHMVERWWIWHARNLGLSETQAEQAFATRRAFWEAARRRDVAGARQALEAYGPAPAALFLYEEGWLAAR